MASWLGGWLQLQPSRLFLVVGVWCGLSGIRLGEVRCSRMLGGWTARVSSYWAGYILAWKQKPRSISLPQQLTWSRESGSPLSVRFCDLGTWNWLWKISGTWASSSLDLGFANLCFCSVLGSFECRCRRPPVQFIADSRFRTVYSIA